MKATGICFHLGVFTALLAASCSNSKRGTAPGSQVLQTVVFETRIDIDSGMETTVDTGFGDLNGDGMADIVALSIAGQVTVQLGAGNGTFQIAQQLDTGSLAVQLELVDVDRDGDLDIIVLRRDPGLVHVLRNDGSANFTAGQVLNVLQAPVYMAVGDLDGDGFPDLVVSDWERTDLTLFRGGNSGEFGTPTQVAIDATTRPVGISIADVTGDGRLDLVLADRVGNRIVILPSDGQTFATPIYHPVGAFPLHLVTGDVDQDGRVDIVCTNYQGRSVSILKAANGFASETIAVLGAPSRVLLADVTNDGVMDLATSIYDQATVVMFRGRPDLTGFDPAVELTAGGQPLRLAAADVNSDGRLDLLASGGLGPRLSLFLSRDGGLIGSYTYPTGIASPEFVVAADFDGDGRGELVVGGRSTGDISVLRTKPGPVPFGAEVEIALSLDVGLPIFNLTKGDFDQDGRLDIAVACQGGVKLLFNVSRGGNLAFELVPGNGSSVLIPADGPFEVQAADMNFDGTTELILTDALRGVVEVHSRLGRAGYSVTRTSIPVSGLPGGLAIADFNRDGILDIAVSRADANLVTILRNIGNLQFEVMVDIPVGAGPNYLRTADFNRDGVADLVVSNGAGDTIDVILSEGTSFRVVDFPVGKRPTALITRDLNNDGFADILVASQVGADFHVLLGDGNGGFPQIVPFAGTYLAVSADLADMDGDSLPDLAIASVATQRISLYRNLSR